HRAIDPGGFLKVYPPRLALRRERIGQVARRFVLPGLYILRCANGELDQYAVCGQSCLDRGERDGSRLGPKLSAARAEDRFQFLDLFFERFESLSVSIRGSRA